MSVWHGRRGGLLRRHLHERTSGVLRAYGGGRRLGVEVLLLLLLGLGLGLLVELLGGRGSVHLLLRLLDAGIVGLLVLLGVGRGGLALVDGLVGRVDARVGVALVVVDVGCGGDGGDARGDGAAVKAGLAVAVEHHAVDREGGDEEHAFRLSDGGTWYHVVCEVEAGSWGKGVDLQLETADSGRGRHAGRENDDGRGRVVAGGVVGVVDEEVSGL